MTIQLDKDIGNADWTKETAWDLGVTDLAGLRGYLIEHGYTVDEFKALPVYDTNSWLHPWLKDIPADLLAPGWTPTAKTSRVSTVTTRKRRP